jgi:Holliday junction resolvase RusA-like endonuclease
MVMAFVVPGPIVPWMRTQSHGTRRFTPPRQRGYQDRVRLVANLARPKGWPLDARYRVTVDVYCDGRKRDIDNCAKTIGDAIEGIAYRNDCHVDDLHVRRHHELAAPRVEVCIEVIGGQ